MCPKITSSSWKEGSLFTVAFYPVTFLHGPLRQFISTLQLLTDHLLTNFHPSGLANAILIFTNRKMKHV